MSDRPKLELIQAWKDVDSRKRITRPELREILSLTRVLLEAEAVRSTYPVLYLYCDWTLHGEINRNETGRAVLAAVAENILGSINGTVRTPDPITGIVHPQSVAVGGLRTIAARALRKEWIEHHAARSIPTDALNSYSGWHHIYQNLLEALCDRPITLGPFDSAGHPLDKKNHRHYDEMLKSVGGDAQLAPHWLRIDRGAAHIPADVKVAELPDNDIGNTLRMMADGYVWVTHSLPDTTQVILITNDEARASFQYD